MTVNDGTKALVYQIYAKL